MKAIKITRNGFKRWLQSKHPRTVVGVGRQQCDCPIGTYLTRLAKQQLGHKPYVVRIEPTKYFYSDGKGNGWTTKAPLWMTNFINHVDRRADQQFLKDGTLFAGILAHRALTLLEAS